MDRRLRHRLRRPSPAVVIALIALVLATGGVTLAAIPGGDGTVTACISRNGDIRLIDAEAGKTCPDTQTTVRLASTDATGKVADADLLDGIDSSGFLGATAKATDADNLDGRDSADFVRIIESKTRVVDYPPIAAHSCISDNVQVSIAAEGARVELGTPITRFTNLIAVGSQVAFSPGPDFRAHFQICNVGDAVIDPPATSFEVLAVRP